MGEQHESCVRCSLRELKASLLSENAMLKQKIELLEFENLALKHRMNQTGIDKKVEVK